MRSLVDTLSADLARADETAARLRWFEARAVHSELELAVRRGELIDEKAATQAFSNAVSLARNRPLGIPA